MDTFFVFDMMRESAGAAKRMKSLAMRRVMAYELPLVIKHTPAAAWGARRRPRGAAATSRCDPGGKVRAGVEETTLSGGMKWHTSA